MSASSSAIDYSSLVTGKQSHPVFLSDLSPDDKPWDTHKSENEAMQQLLLGAEGADIERIRERLKGCGPWLIFNHTVPDERGRTFKLYQASFCRVRTCPFCQWRRSMMYTARILEALPGIMERYPTMRILHLTLTVKNVGITELRATIDELNKGWRRLTKRKEVSQIVRGYIKSIEVTRSKIDGSAHPHIHALLFVPGYYFERKEYYIIKDKWIELWKNCFRADYDPSIKIQACREAQGTEKIVREVVKYSTKPQDLLQDSEWLVSYIRQVHKLRFFSTGGIVKEMLGELEQENEDLVHVGEEEAAADNDILAQSWFDWKKEVARYQHKETRTRPK